MSLALCNKCQKPVPSQHVERENRVYLVKTCPDCGLTETLLSSDLARYNHKRSLDSGFDHPGCTLDCLHCRHPKSPTLAFVDVTSRCNQNCPVCINNTPSMRFEFDPPIEYFARIFDHCATLNPQPAVQLFGGEPTMREDLFEIIDMAKSRGLRPRVVTNGIKLADKAYCERLVKTRATVLFAFDGLRPETYRKVRGTDKILKLKLQALENLRQTGKAKVVLMSLIARDLNHDEIGDLLQFCHDRRDFIRGLYLMPLAHAWKAEQWDYDPGRITTEDLEGIVNDAFPGEEIAFLPAGMLGDLATVRRALNVGPLPFLGAHPNCESTYMFFSDGEKYVPIARHLKTSTMALARDLLACDKVLARRLDAAETGVVGKLAAAVGLKKIHSHLVTACTLLPVVRRNMKIASQLQGEGLGKAGHVVRALFELLSGKRSSKVLERHLKTQDVLQLVVLPFEDYYCVDTERLERCPAAFAFNDVEAEVVRFVPVCAWPIHKNTVLRKITDHYANSPATRSESTGPTLVGANRSR